jgi:hypothetical protein
MEHRNKVDCQGNAFQILFYLVRDVVRLPLRFKVDEGVTELDQSLHVLARVHAGIHFRFSSHGQGELELI